MAAHTERSKVEKDDDSKLDQLERRLARVVKKLHAHVTESTTKDSIKEKALNCFNACQVKKG